MDESLTQEQPVESTSSAEENIDAKSSLGAEPVPVIEASHGEHPKESPTQTTVSAVASQDNGIAELPGAPEAEKRPQMTKMAQAVAASRSLEQPTFAPLPTAFEQPAAPEPEATANEVMTATKAEKLLQEALNQSEKDRGSDSADSSAVQQKEVLATEPEARPEPPVTNSPEESSNKTEEASESADTDLDPLMPSQRRRSRAHNDPRARRNTQRLSSSAEQTPAEETTKATNTEESNL